MDFVFMLTRADQTVPDCLEVLDYILPVGITHIGFKDIGVSMDTMRELAKRIRDAGCVSYMEVVSTSQEACYQSARVAREIGIDRLLGGTDVTTMMGILGSGSSVAYYPFPGRPFGHPTKLGGTASDVEAHCRAFMEQGCGGCDLLAYRAVEADPLELVRAARRGLGKGYLLCAGSVHSAAQIRELKAAGADAFTVGSAAFDGSFSPTKGSLRSQLKDILAVCE